MDPRELLAAATRYRRTALLVSDDEMTRGLLELAEEYEALADRLSNEGPPPEKSGGRQG